MIHTHKHLHIWIPQNLLAINWIIKVTTLCLPLLSIFQIYVLFSVHVQYVYLKGKTRACKFNTRLQDCFFFSFSRLLYGFVADKGIGTHRTNSIILLLLKMDFARSVLLILHHYPYLLGLAFHMPPVQCLKHEQIVCVCVLCSGLAWQATYASIPYRTHRIVE